MLKYLASYKQLNRYIYYLIIAELLIQCVHASFFVLFNYYLSDLGYKDYEIAHFITYRYIAVLIVGFPVGWLLKKGDLLSIIKYGSLFFVLNSFAIIYFAAFRNAILMNILMSLFGVFLLLSHVVALPLLMRMVSQKEISLSLSLFFQTWPFGITLVGFISFVLQKINPIIFNNKSILQILICLSIFSTVLLFRIPKNILSTSQNKTILNTKTTSKDWLRIIKVLIPTIIIAIGAGFTIPFFNLFFLKTYQMSSEHYSLMTGISHLIVIVFMFFTPYIRTNYSYKTGIIGIQALGTLCLFLLILVSNIPNFYLSYSLAILFFTIRQPLMNSAGPIISEFVLKYVGKKNQPLVGTLESSIWSGAFLFSSIIFGYLRKNEYAYQQIFYITLILYVLGVTMWYFILSKKITKK